MRELKSWEWKVSWHPPTRKSTQSIDTFIIRQTSAQARLQSNLMRTWERLWVLTLIGFLRVGSYPACKQYHREIFRSQQENGRAKYGVNEQSGQQLQPWICCRISKAEQIAGALPSVRRHLRRFIKSAADIPGHLTTSGRRTWRQNRMCLVQELCHPIYLSHCDARERPSFSDPCLTEIEATLDNELYFQRDPRKSYQTI